MCDVGIDGLFPDSNYEFECWSLAIPDQRFGGHFTTAMPTLGCGPFSCMGINALTGLMTVWNATATQIVETTMPVRHASTNGKTHCGIHAADVRINVLTKSAHVVECLGTQVDLMTTETSLYSLSLGEFHQCGVMRKEQKLREGKLA